jgi:DNA invertase Pin-like site-specific DNA recombinase
MAAVNNGTVTSIVTEDISRISRDFADAAHIFKQLQYARVPLISVSDGIDTSAKHAKLTYTLKSLVAELYIDDLRDKTLRGMEGRMLAGYATGSVPYGYRTRPEIDQRGREIGKMIEIVDDAARIVIRIFTEFANGRGLSVIARSLNAEGILSPRIGTRHRWSGWSVGTVREMLRNERYIGVWRFKTMQWVKVPGTNRRLPRKRPASEAMVRHQPELRIIDLPLWHAVQATIAKGSPMRGRRRPKVSVSALRDYHVQALWRRAHDLRSEPELLPLPLAGARTLSERSITAHVALVGRCLRRDQDRHSQEPTPSRSARCTKRKPWGGCADADPRQEEGPCRHREADRTAGEVRG